MPDDSANSESPSSLFHYTSAEGLLGILQKAALPNAYKDSLRGELTMAKSFSLWATDARYLNDREELTWECQIKGGSDRGIC